MRTVLLFHAYLSGDFQNIDKEYAIDHYLFYLWTGECLFSVPLEYPTVKRRRTVVGQNNVEYSLSFILIHSDESASITVGLLTLFIIYNHTKGFILNFSIACLDNRVTNRGIDVRTDNLIRFLLRLSIFNFPRETWSAHSSSSSQHSANCSEGEEEVHGLLQISWRSDMCLHVCHANQHIKCTWQILLFTEDHHLHSIESILDDFLSNYRRDVTTFVIIGQRSICLLQNEDYMYIYI